jgi:hypothetical protein
VQNNAHSDALLQHQHHSQQAADQEPAHVHHQHGRRDQKAPEGRSGRNSLCTPVHSTPGAQGNAWGPSNFRSSCICTHTYIHTYIHVCVCVCV